MPTRESREIVDAAVFGAQIPYRRGYRWAFNEYVGPCVGLIKLVDRDGREGWGEIPLSFHPTIPGDAVLAMTSALIERLALGHIPAPRRLVSYAMSLTGWLWYPNLAANVVGGVEMAMWDLLGRQLEVHVTDLLGGRVRDAMECMWFIFDDTPEQMAAETKRGAERGFRTFYVKWFGEAADMRAKLSAVRDALPAGARLRIDPNESWTRASALLHLGEMRGWPLEFVEQPLPRYDRHGMSELRRRTQVPIVSDQGTRTLEETLAGLVADECDVLSICPSDSGGIARALDCATVSRAYGVPVFLHSNNETGIGTAGMVAVACLAENCSYASQTEFYHLDWEITEGLRFDGPFLRVDFTPGLGVRLVDDKLRRAQDNYDAGQANRLPIDAAVEPRFVPGY